MNFMSIADMKYLSTEARKFYRLSANDQADLKWARRGVSRSTSGAVRFAESCMVKHSD